MCAKNQNLWDYGFHPYSKLSLKLLQYFTYKRMKQVTLKIEYVTFESPTLL